ncbi:hypothetical protein Tco_1155701 [Tanacetum coccineum]
MSSNSTNGTNGAVNTVLGATTTSTQATAVNSTTIDNLSDVVIWAFFASQPNSPQHDYEDLQQIYPDDLKGIDLRWQMAMLTMRAGRFFKNTKRKFFVNGTKTIGFDKSKMQTQESKINTGKALDADLVDTKSIRKDSTVQDDNSRSGNDTDVDDADIRPIYDEEPMAEVQLTTECNIFAIGQQHTEQPEIINEDLMSTAKATSLLLIMMQLKAHIQEKVLGKPVLPSLRNQSVVRQPNAFKSERAQMSKQRFASQVDVNKNLSKPVTQHYLPKKTESAFAKPDHVIASSSSRNSSKNMPRFSSNGSCTADDSKPKPRSNNQTSRSLPVSKSSRVTITAVPKADHSKSYSSFSDSKQFVCSTCHKFSPNKTSAVYEKTSPRSDLRWKPTGRIFKSIGLRWIPTRKLFDSYISKIDSEPPYGTNVDIPNIHECKQTLDVSAGTSINVQKEQSLDLSAGSLCNVNKENLRKFIKQTVTTSNELDLLFGPLFDEYFNGENQVVLKSSAVTTTDASNKRQQQPGSTSSTSTLAIKCHCYARGGGDGCGVMMAAVVVSWRGGSVWKRVMVGIG